MDRRTVLAVASGDRADKPMRPLVGRKACHTYPSSLVCPLPSHESGLSPGERPRLILHWAGPLTTLRSGNRVGPIAPVEGAPPFNIEIRSSPRAPSGSKGPTRCQSALSLCAHSASTGDQLASLYPS